MPAPLASAKASLVKKFSHSSDNKSTSSSSSSSNGITSQLQNMSIHSLSGKVAIVTGGSKGIGRSTVLRLAREGAKVVFSYSSDAKAAQALVDHIGDDKVLAVKADASSITDGERLIKETVTKLGKIDILFLNAGSLPYADLANTTEQAFDATFNLNVKGPYFLCQKAVPHMPAGSHIILASTSLSKASTIIPAYLLYLATKGAVEQMVRVLSKDLAGQKGISVNAISPGPTDTDLFGNGMTDDVRKYVEGLVPSGRIGKPEEVADAVSFLASDASRWVSGQVVHVNGGFA